MKQYGILVDVERCSGCMTCVVACKAENLTGPGVSWLKILQVEDRQRDRIYYVRHACMHCEQPPCLADCPQEAISRSAEGVVTVNEQKCIACGACREACPYGVPNFGEKSGYFAEPTPLERQAADYRKHDPTRSSKCTLCLPRLQQGKEPFCVASCPAKALYLVDYANPDERARRLMAQAKAVLAAAGSKPRVRYLADEGALALIEERFRRNPTMA